MDEDLEAYLNDAIQFRRTDRAIMDEVRKGIAAIRKEMTSYLPGDYSDPDQRSGLGNGSVKKFVSRIYPDYRDPRFELPSDPWLIAHAESALENARRIRERWDEMRLRDHERRLQARIDEEGCGAVFGALLAQMWQREEHDDAQGL